MTALANLSLLNTFDEQRIRINQIIYKLDQDENNAINIISNTSTINISGKATIGNTIYIDSNAYSRLGGDITGNVYITGNMVSNVVNANTIFVREIFATGNITVSGTGVINLL